MSIKVILLGALGLAALSACARPEPRKLPFETLAVRSCAISCPASGAEPAVGGSVECTPGAAPVCQCTNRDRPLASCEVVE